jgi:hypothetical protein
MHSRLCLFLTALLILACTSSAFTQSDIAATRFTLQVASFPDTELANKFVVQLAKAGEHPATATVELQGRGFWTRVFVGSFPTTDAARRYGDNLKARGIIAEFLVRKAELNQAFTRPRQVSPSAANTTDSAGRTDYSSKTQTRHLTDERIPSSVKSDALPVRSAKSIVLAPRIDTSQIPRPDPVTLAFRLVVELSSVADTPRGRGGLWLRGDTVEGLSRLRWIAGEKNAGLIRIDDDGRVQLDKRLLASVAGLSSTRVDDPLQVADYIASNEGLLLLVQLAEGGCRYLLHIGNEVPTRGKSIEIKGSINLDNNFDSRINPYRKHGRKLDEERPPEGFAAVVGLNPVAQWFNLSTHGWVPVGEITLHELAEAHAKVALGLDYLDQGSSAGAHALALDRERRLKAQRPGAGIVLTAGSNRVLRTQQEIRLFYAESAGEIGKQ